MQIMKKERWTACVSRLPVHDDIDVTRVLHVARTQVDVVSLHKANLNWEVYRELARLYPALQLVQDYPGFMPVE